MNSTGTQGKRCGDEVDGLSTDTDLMKCIASLTGVTNSRSVYFTSLPEIIDTICSLTNIDVIV